MGAEIWRLPAAGGAPATLYYHLSRAGVAGMPTTMVAVGTDLHVFMWYASTATAGEHVSVSTATAAPTLTRRGRLPFTTANTCSRIPVLPVEGSYDPRSGLIVLGGRSADVVWRMPTGVTVRHDVATPGGCPATRSNLSYALSVNTDTGAVLLGDGAGTLEEKICLDGTWRNNVQTVLANAFVMSLDYFASGSLYRRTGGGCRQTNGQIPCNYVRSLPTRGNTNFALTVQTTSGSGLFAIGATQVNLSLGALAPGCVIGPALHFIGVGTPTATGLRSATFTIPPGLPPGAFAYVQWAVPDPINPLGWVFSDTRYIKP